MHVFLQKQRLILRRFTGTDLNNLAELDQGPEVMRFINGSRQTPRELIHDEILPGFMRYYERFEGFGFWAVIENLPESFWDGFTSGHGQAVSQTRSNLTTGCANQRGTRVMRARAPGR